MSNVFVMILTYTAAGLAGLFIMAVFAVKAWKFLKEEAGDKKEEK